MSTTDLVTTDACRPGTAVRGKRRVEAKWFLLDLLAICCSVSSPVTMVPDLFALVLQSEPLDVDRLEANVPEY